MLTPLKQQCLNLIGPEVLLVSSVTNFESSFPLFWLWSFYLQSEKL